MQKLRKIILFVGIANLVYFGVEFYFAFRSGSVSLLADSIDFLEDAFVNFLILLALNWKPIARIRLGKVLALILLLPTFSTFWAAIHKLSIHTIPDPHTLSWVGVGALIINSLCAFLLISQRNVAGSLTKAAFLSARNDMFANVGIIIAGFMTFYIQSYWPDLIVGLAIASMNLDAAKEVWLASHKESNDLKIQA